jgi:hypothetical protein
VGGDVMMLDLQSKVQKGLNSSKGYVNSDSNKDPLNRKDLNRRKKLQKTALEEKKSRMKAEEKMKPQWQQLGFLRKCNPQNREH